MGEAVLAPDMSTASSSITTSTHSPSGVVFVLSVMDHTTVLATAPPAHKILPVPIQAAFPHIMLQLGHDLGSSQCPSIRCVIDTAAALTTGNFHFFTKISKAYPYTVAIIYSNSDYSPIVLTGIVQHNGMSVSTDLTVAFKFTMPYLTREGQETSLLIATSPNITINTILGLPFIQQTKMTINAANRVAELRVLDAPPFPIDFRHAVCTVLAVSTNSSPSTSPHTYVIRTVKKLEAYYANPVTPPQPSPGILLSGKRARTVAFVDHLPLQITADKSATLVSIGSKLEPDYAVHANDSNLRDLPLSV